MLHNSVTIKLTRFNLGVFIKNTYLFRPDNKFTVYI